MPSAERHCVLLSKLNHRGISAGASHQAFTGSLTEGEPKLDSRHGADQGLVDVFDGLDEMGLSEDEIRRVRLVDSNRSELHGHLLAPARTRLRPRAQATLCGNVAPRCR